MEHCDPKHAVATVTHADLGMALDDTASIREGAEVGLEFTACDLTDQGHRIRCFFHDNGTVELVVVHGPKCEDAGEPTEVFELTPNQMDHFLRFAVRVDRIDSAVREVARHLRDGRHEPETLAIAAIASLMSINSRDLLKTYLSSLDG